MAAMAAMVAFTPLDMKSATSTATDHYKNDKKKLKWSYRILDLFFHFFLVGTDQKTNSQKKSEIQFDHFYFLSFFGEVSSNAESSTDMSKKIRHGQIEAICLFFLSKGSAGKLLFNQHPIGCPS